MLSPRILSLKARQDQLTAAREKAQSQLEQRRAELPTSREIKGYVADFREFLEEGTFPERKALIRNFVQGIEIVEDEAVLKYTIPMPSDGATSESASVLDFVQSGPVARPLLTGGAFSLSRDVGGRDQWQRPIHLQQHVASGQELDLVDNPSAGLESVAYLVEQCPTTFDDGDRPLQPVDPASEHVRHMQLHHQIVARVCHGGRIRQVGKDQKVVLTHRRRSLGRKVGSPVQEDGGGGPEPLLPSHPLHVVVQYAYFSLPTNRPFIRLRLSPDA